MLFLRFVKACLAFAFAREKVFGTITMSDPESSQRLFRVLL